MSTPINNASHSLSTLASLLPSMEMDLKRAIASVTIADTVAMKTDFVGVLGGLKFHPVEHLPTGAPIGAVGGSSISSHNPHPISPPIVLPLDNHSI